MKRTFVLTSTFVALAILTSGCALTLTKNYYNTADDPAKEITKTKKIETVGNDINK